MIVILNNGTRIRIEKETAKAIIQALLKSKEVPEKWHCIVDTVNNEASAFNAMQIAAICAEEDILQEAAGALHEIGLFLDTLPVDDSHGRFWAEKFRRFVLDKKSSV